MKDGPRQVDSAEICAGQRSVREVTFSHAGVLKSAIFHREIGKIAIMQKAIFKTHRKERFVTFVKLRPHNFALHKVHIVQTAPVEFRQAQIAPLK